MKNEFGSFPAAYEVEELDELNKKTDCLVTGLRYFYSKNRDLEVKYLLLGNTCYFMVLEEDGFWTRVTDNKTVQAIRWVFNGMPSSPTGFISQLGMACRDNKTVMGDVGSVINAVFRVVQPKENSIMLAQLTLAKWMLNNRATEEEVEWILS